jgi:hypothetical protein
MSRGGERCACFGRRIVHDRFGFAGSRRSGGVAERRSLSSGHDVKRALACADGVVRWPGQSGLTFVPDQFIGRLRLLRIVLRDADGTRTRFGRVAWWERSFRKQLTSACAERHSRGCGV